MSTGGNNNNTPQESNRREYNNHSRFLGCVLSQSRKSQTVTSPNAYISTPISKSSHFLNTLTPINPVPYPNNASHIKFNNIKNSQPTSRPNSCPSLLAPSSLPPPLPPPQPLQIPSDSSSNFPHNNNNINKSKFADYIQLIPSVRVKILKKGDNQHNFYFGIYIKKSTSSGTIFPNNSKIHILNKENYDTLNGYSSTPLSDSNEYKNETQKNKKIDN